MNLSNTTPKSAYGTEWIDQMQHELLYMWLCMNLRNTTQINVCGATWIYPIKHKVLPTGLKGFKSWWWRLGRNGWDNYECYITKEVAFSSSLFNKAPSRMKRGCYFSTTSLRVFVGVRFNQRALAKSEHRLTSAAGGGGGITLARCLDTLWYIEDARDLPGDGTLSRIWRPGRKVAGKTIRPTVTEKQRDGVQAAL